MIQPSQLRGSSWICVSNFDWIWNSLQHPTTDKCAQWKWVQRIFCLFLNSGSGRVGCQSSFSWSDSKCTIWNMFCKQKPIYSIYAAKAVNQATRHFAPVFGFVAAVFRIPTENFFLRCPSVVRYVQVMDTEVTFIRCCCSCDHNCNSLSCVNQKVKYDVCVCVGPMCARESECVCCRREETRREERTKKKLLRIYRRSMNFVVIYI